MAANKTFSDLVTLRDELMAHIRSGDYATAQQRLIEARAFIAMTPDVENETKRIEWRNDLEKLQAHLSGLESASYGVQTALITRVCHVCED
jgi:hypothetical protein